MVSSLPVGKVQTVLGPISPKDLGITLTHEHLLLDLRPIAMEKPRGAWQRAIYEAPLSQDNIGWVRYHEITNLDNYLLADIDVAIDEAMLYKRFGGGTLVEATNPDIGRDAAGLAGISQENRIAHRNGCYPLCRCRASCGDGNLDGRRHRRRDR